MEAFSYKSGLLVSLFGKLSFKWRLKAMASSHTTDVYRLNPEGFLKKTEKIKVFSGFFSSLSFEYRDNSYTVPVIKMNRVHQPGTPG